MRPEDILTPTPVGTFCKLGSFHIDPTRPVERALITHAHSDHARAGHGAVLATQETLDLMRLRYGDNFAATTQAAHYGESVSVGEVKVTLHPAGHVLGSAQALVEANGVRVVASGDYKDVADPTCAPFELVPCDLFITEATFALPVFHHGDPRLEIAKLLHSLALFPERAHLIGAYSLGKAQRVIALLRQQGYQAPIYLHGAMERITQYYASRGIELGELRVVRGADKVRIGWNNHALPAVGTERPLGAPVPGPAHGDGIGMDAHPRSRPAIRCGVAIGDFRSRGLERTDRNGGRNRGE